MRRFEQFRLVMAALAFLKGGAQTERPGPEDQLT